MFEYAMKIAVFYLTNDQKLLVETCSDKTVQKNWFKMHQASVHSNRLVKFVKESCTNEEATNFLKAVFLKLQFQNRMRSK